MNKVIPLVEKAVAVSHPFIYVQTDEELEFLESLKESLDDTIIFSYDEVIGLKWINKEAFENNRLYLNIINLWNDTDSIKNFEEALSYIENFSREFKTAFIIFDFSALVEVENPERKKIIRSLKNISNSIKMGELALSIFLVSSKLTIPEILEKEIIVVEPEYPGREEIGEILDSFLKEYDLTLASTLRTRFVSALQGLSRTEIENLLHIAIATNDTLDERDIDLFEDYKKQTVKKNAILEFIDLRNVNTDLGGLKNLKKWFERKRKIFADLDKARNEGVDIPKGVLLFGMPGCGKSLAAKYAAKLMRLPLLRLDMGRIMGQYLGQSEENLRKAIKVAESIAPSILWIDEIEKALSGVQGGSGSDTLARIFGTLLTWMQEKEKPVFVIATANNISNIPPEFLRKGRFDEIFFVDFPDDNSIKEIFKIHFNKRGKKIDSVNLDIVLQEIKKNLKGKDKGYSGADIEAIVSEVVENAFLEGKTEISTEDVIKVVKESKPIVETLKDTIEILKELCKRIDAKPAD